MIMNFDHYTIRLLQQNDFDAFYAMVNKNRDRLADFFTGTVTRTKTREDTQHFVTDILAKSENRLYFPYVIVDTEKNDLIGFIDLKNIDWSIPKSELGCYIDAEYEGRGIMMNAMMVFCDYCFDHFHFKKLFLRTHERNMGARKIAETCRFRVEGTIRADYKTTSGEIVDLIYYGRMHSD